jgi:N-acetylneuraminate synthase
LEHSFNINGRIISPDQPPYIVAEISGNHGGELTRAIKLISEAKSAGADAVKIQSYTPDSITIDHDGPEFILNNGLWRGQKLYDLYQKAHTPIEWHKPLFEHANKIGITIFSSPFDQDAVKLLEELGVPAYKIASPEIVEINLIETCATTGKPIIISTGMASVEEIEHAVSAARDAGATNILLLHCISAYPTPIEESNLTTIRDLSERYRTSVGLSDHTSGSLAASLAVAQGAVLIEKHFTLSRHNGAIDNAFSLEPNELKQLIKDTNTAYFAMGEPTYRPTKSEKSTLILRRSLYAVSDIKVGDTLTSKNIRSIRPNLGLDPKFYRDILGKSAAKNIKRGQPLDFSMIDGLED